jgi:serine/threonine protein kinase
LDSRSLLGTVIGGYRLEAVIGRGGMGVVYLAEQQHLRRKAAVKLLPPELANDPAFRERFTRESLIAASLEHPNVLPVYDAGEADGRLYIAMRYVRGFDLDTLLRRSGPPPLPRALDILGQVAGGLDAAHAAGQNLVIEVVIARRGCRLAETGNQLLDEAPRAEALRQIVPCHGPLQEPAVTGGPAVLPVLHDDLAA